MSRTGRWAILALAVALCAAPVWASGFSIYEQSAKASGQAGAWVARADDAGANWYNPAAIVRGEGMQFQFGTNFITVGIDTTLTVGDQQYEAESSVVTPSHFYFTHKINDRWGWGIGVNNPIGLVTEWDTLPVTLSSRRAELVTYVVNPNLAFAINDQWAIAVGLDYMYADVGEFSRDIDQGSFPGIPAGTIGKSDLTGDGDDTSWNVALHFDGDRIDLGLTYRDGFDIEIDGDVEFTNIVSALGPGGIPGQLCTGGMGCFPNGPGSTTLGLPAQAAVGIAWGYGGAWTFEFDLAYAEWSAFKEIALDFQNETALPVAPNVAIPVVEDTTLREDWDDTLSYRLGAAWRMRDSHELRFGALYDESPVPTDTLRPSIPDADRTSVTFGYGYIGKRWNIDAYYMPLFFDDIEAGPTSDGSFEDGVIPGKYESFVHLLGVTFNVRF